MFIRCPVFQFPSTFQLVQVYFVPNRYAQNSTNGGATQNRRNQLLTGSIWSNNRYPKNQVIANRIQSVVFMLSSSHFFQNCVFVYWYIHLYYIMFSISCKFFLKKLPFSQKRVNMFYKKPKGPGYRLDPTPVWVLLARYCLTQALFAVSHCAE